VPQAGAVTPFPLLEGLSDAELQTMRLDGEAYRLGEAYLPIGVPPLAATRAAAALGARSPRLIAALATAAWIWGAVPHPPQQGEFLVDLAARWRPPFGGNLVVIESAVHADDIVRYGRSSVTTPLRTAIDFARFRTDFGEADADAARRLADIGRFDVDAAVLAMDRGRNLSGKHTAAERLRAALSPS
jgi:hypothetical protein